MKQKKDTLTIGKISRGFTLTEAVIAVFIFSLTMISIVSIFSKFIVVQKRSKAIQQNIENARYALELMSKTIRTSTVISCNGSATCPAATNSVEIYDVSQKRCIIYRYSSSKINSAVSAEVADKRGCTAAVFTGLTPTPIVDKTISKINFRVDQTVVGTKVGLVTISVEICSDPSCSGTENDRAYLQTTVSLRDYEETSI